jgi:hypothetical protein
MGGLPFDKKKIFLPKELCETLDTFVKEMRSKSIGFGTYVVHLKEESASAESQQKKMEAWIEASSYFNEQAPLARAALEDELRAIMSQ